MDIILRQAVPYKNLHYFRSYFTTMHQITSNKNWTEIRHISLLLGVSTYELFHFTYLSLHFKITPEEQWRHYDAFRLVELPGATGLNIAYSCLHLMTVYFLYLLYFSRHTQTTTFLLYHILVLEQPGWFLETTTTFKSHQNLQISVVDLSKKLFMIVVNSLQIFPLVIDFFILISQAHTVLHYFYQGTEEIITLSTYLNLAATQASLLIRYACLHTYAHVCILMATLGVVIGQLFIHKLGQLRRMLYPSRKRLFGILSLYRYAAFLREAVSCLQYITSANRLFSRALTAYIIVNCPLNAMLMATLLLPSGSSLSPEVKLFTVVIMAQQWLCTFAVHLQEAALNERLHRPSRRALYLLAAGDRWADLVKQENCDSSLQLKLKVAHYIAAFHVPSERRYGITYWNGSLITMMSFAEFVILYSQILMYSFKWYHEDRLL